MDSSFSLYIHIPFCASFCDYCDFYSVKENKNIDAFLCALVSDIKEQMAFFNAGEICTAYIGGGTPSVLGKKIGVLFDALKETPRFSPVEFTIEANPESATEEFLSVCKEGGVNRLSLGVQSFCEPSRRAVNRKGSRSLLLERLALCSRFFPAALSADLITGLPYQSEQSVVEDVKCLLSFAPAHVSLYSLSVESETPLEKKVKTKTVKLPAGDLADSLWLTGRDALLKEGFSHYEVSNFAREGKHCLHNLRYWRMESWLGAGPAASGTIIDEKTGTAKRFTFARDVNEYIKTPSVRAAVCEDLNKEALMRESLLMGFRRAEGPDPEIFSRRFGISPEELIPNTLAKWKEKDKMLFLNGFLREAFLEMEKSALF